MDGLVTVSGGGKVPAVRHDVPGPAELAGVRVIAFDLDDTLAVSKSRISDRMAVLLTALLAKFDVLIISGGRFEQFDIQVIRQLSAGPDTLARLHIMPTCGTRYYRWSGGGWRQVYAEDLAGPEKREVIAALTEGARELGLWEPHPWGEIIEDRGSQITFSALGQEAPPDAKYAWDPDGTKRRRLREYVAGRLPRLDVRMGGSTSLDITRQGIDKAYGMRKLMEQLTIGPERIIFVGDRLEEGGNDYPVRATGVPCVAVTRWEDTADYVAELLRAARSAPAPD